MEGKVHPLQKSLARINRKGGYLKQTLGGGVVISDAHILTCAHVVKPGFAMSPEIIEKLEVTFDLNFPFSKTKEIIAAKVVFLDIDADLAVLECLNKIPSDIKSAQFRLVDDFWGREIQAFGFPKNYDEGVWVEAKLRGQNTLGWIEIVDVQSTGHFIQQGFSGGPIWDNKLRSFVGLIVAVDSNPDIRTGYLIPTIRICEKWNGLRVKKAGKGSDLSQKRANNNNLKNQLEEKVNQAYGTMSQTVEPGFTSNSVPHVFLSYQSGDAQQAQQIRDVLQNIGIRVWRDQDSIPTGAQFSLAIEQAIRRSKVVVTLVSQAATESIWVRNEILFAMEYKKSIIPLLLEADVKLPIEIIGTQNINMAEEWSGGLDKLIKRIQFLLQKHPAVSLKPTHEPQVTAVNNSNQNPFIFGGAVPADLFTERKSALNAIVGRVGNHYSLQSISVVAERRMGKTSLLNFIWKMPTRVFSSDHTYTTIYMDAMDASTHSIPGFMRTFRKSIHGQLGRSPWREKDDGNLTVFTDAIQEITDGGKRRIILLLDEFESVMAHQELDILLDTLRSNGSHSRIGMIVATAHELPELEMEGKLVSRFSNIFQTYYLGLFSKNESIQLINQAFKRSGQSATDEEIDLINELSGRHPYLVQLAGSILWGTEKTKFDLQNIKLNFAHSAKNVYAGILQRLNSSQLNAVRYLCGIKTRKKISENILFDLRAKGILDESNAVFSNYFADYLRNEMR